jgi:hypothetical protein
MALKHACILLLVATNAIRLGDDATEEHKEEHNHKGVQDTRKTDVNMDVQTNSPLIYDSGPPLAEGETVAGSTLEGCEKLSGLDDCKYCWVARTTNAWSLDEYRKKPEAGKGVSNPGIQEIFVITLESAKRVCAEFIQKIGIAGKFHWQNVKGEWVTEETNWYSGAFGFATRPTGEYYLNVWQPPPRGAEGHKFSPINVQALPDWFHRVYSQTSSTGDIVSVFTESGYWDKFLRYVYEIYGLGVEHGLQGTKDSAVAAGLGEKAVLWSNQQMNEDCLAWLGHCEDMQNERVWMDGKDVGSVIEFATNKGEEPNYGLAFPCLNTIQKPMGFASGVKDWFLGKSKWNAKCPPAPVGNFEARWEFRLLMLTNGFFAEWLGSGYAGLRKEPADGGRGTSGTMITDENGPGTQDDEDAWEPPARVTPEEPGERLGFPEYVAGAWEFQNTPAHSFSIRFVIPQPPRPPP